MEASTFTIREDLPPSLVFGRVHASDEDSINTTFSYQMSGSECFHIFVESSYEVQEVSRPKNIDTDEIYLRVDVTSSREAYIEISNEVNSHRYRIVIGGDSNQRSTIEKCEELSCREVASAYTPGVLKSHGSNFRVRANVNGVAVFKNDHEINSENADENMDTIVKYEIL